MEVPCPGFCHYPFTVFSSVHSRRWAMCISAGPHWFTVQTTQRLSYNIQKNYKTKQVAFPPSTYKACCCFFMTSFPLNGCPCMFPFNFSLDKRAYGPYPQCVLLVSCLKARIGPLVKFQWLHTSNPIFKAILHTVTIAQLH